MQKSNRFELIAGEPMLPWHEDSIEELVLQGIECLPVVQDRNHILELPSNSGSDFVLRLGNTGGLGVYPKTIYEAADWLDHFSTELQRLDAIGKSYGIPRIVARYAMYIDRQSTRPFGIQENPKSPYYSITADTYTVVEKIDDGQTLADRPESPEKDKLLEALGATLLDYIAPGSIAYLEDITSLHQYSPEGVLYDIETDMISVCASNEGIPGKMAIREITKWYIPRPF